MGSSFAALLAGTTPKNSPIVPDNETIESCGHNTRGKDRIPFDKVLKKTLEITS